MTQLPGLRGRPLSDRDYDLGAAIHPLLEGG